MSGAKTFSRSYDGTPLCTVTMKRPGNKRWMLLWPGFGYSSRNRHFKMMLREMNKHFNLIIIDLRAHGENKSEFSFDKQCEDIVYFTNRIAKKHKGLFVFGHSLTATALLQTASRLPTHVHLILFAPVRGLSHRVPRPFKNGINWLKKCWPFMARVVLRCGLLFTNIKTGNIIRTGLFHSASQWGECRLNSRAFLQFWDLALTLHFTFPKVKQKGLLIYGPKDKLLVPFKEYEEHAKQTGLTLARLEKFNHHVKSKRPGKGKRKRAIVTNTITDYADNLEN